jgi:hypothetical protein
MCKKVALLLVIAIATGSAFAGPYWTGNVSQAWGNTGNWDSGALPAAGSYAGIATPITGTYPVISTETVSMPGGYILGDGTLAAPGYLSITGGAVSAAAIVGGYGPGTAGYVSISGGQIEVAYLYAAGAHYADGDATVGTIDISGSANVVVDNRVIMYDDYGGKAGGVVGTLNLTGGTLTVNSGNPFVMSNSNCTPLCNITAGVMYLQGDWTGSAYAYSQAGWLKAYGGAGVLHYDYNVTTPGYTTVWATPEPATLTLIGLGLVWMRRKN